MNKRVVHRRSRSVSAPQRELEQHADTVWGKSEGILAVRVIPCEVCGGKFAEAEFSWPDQRREFIDFVERNRSTGRIAAGALLRDPHALNRFKSEAVLPGTWYWADIDEPVDLALLRSRLSSLDGFVVASGGQPGRFHVYGRLEKDADAESLRTLNIALKKYLGGDSAHSPHQPLALPGTLNHKPCEEGQRPVPLRRVAALDGPLRTVTELLSKFRSQDGEAPPSYLDDILGEEPGDKRGGQAYHQVAALVEAGLDDATILELCQKSLVFAEKFEGRVEREVENVLKKLRLDHDHAGLRCADAGCPSTPDWMTYRLRESRRTLTNFDEFTAKVISLDWLVPGILPRASHGMIAGAAKSFKSYVALDLAIAVACGTKFLNHFEVEESGPVLLYCDEGSHAELQRRLKRLSAAQRVERVPDLHISLGNPTCTRGELQSQLRQDLRRFKPVLVILDPWYAFHGGESDATNLFAQGDLLRSIQVPCTDAGAALLIVNHFRKGAKLSLESITQSGGAEWCDTWILVESGRPSGDDIKLKVVAGSRSGGDSHLGVEVRGGLATGLWTPLAWAVRENLYESVEDQILRVCAEEADDGVTKDEIRGRVGRNRELVSKSVDSLLAQGRLEHRDRKYFPTDSLSS